MAGGVERVLTLKANYFADVDGFDITIVLTEGKDKPFFYPLSNKIKVVNLNIGFEELWACSFLKKIIVYVFKQYLFKKRLSQELMRIRPDITISLLRREINFINNIKDGSKKIGELHVNRSNYRNFEANDSNYIKNFFSKLWMRDLVSNIRKLDRFVVLTEEDKKQWGELNNVISISDPVTFFPNQVSSLQNKRVLAVGRYVYQKGFDLLLQSWSKIERKYPDWKLEIYGSGNRSYYEQLIIDHGIDASRCLLNGPSADIKKEYLNSSIFVFSSRFEGFGMVLVEAMACGLPVISFDCPCGPRDIISNEEDGLLVKNGNVDELAYALTELMNDSSLRSKMAMAGRRNVERFKLEYIAKKWESLFDELYE